MELKLCIGSIILSSSHVLIVPLWNWNWSNWFRLLLSESVLIVPLWNWNYLLSIRRSAGHQVLIVPLWNWNFAEAAFLKRLRLVLIVPLWNWNSGCWWFDELLKRSNRTFMELKLMIACAVSKLMSCSNRTFMELKLGREFEPHLSHTVLIVPLWNWNCGKGVWWQREDKF